MSIYLLCLPIHSPATPSNRVYKWAYIGYFIYVHMVFAGYIFIVRYTLLGIGFEANKLLSGSPKFLCLLDILIGLSFSVWTQLHFPPRSTLPYQQHPIPILTLYCTYPAEFCRNNSGPKRLTYLSRNHPPQKLAKRPRPKWPRAETTRIHSDEGDFKILVKVVHFRRNFTAHFRELREDQGGITCMKPVWNKVRVEIPHMPYIILTKIW